MLKVNGINKGDLLVLTKPYPLYNPYYPVGEKFKFTGFTMACGYRILLSCLDSNLKTIYIPLGYLKKEN